MYTAVLDMREALNKSQHYEYPLHLAQGQVGKVKTDECMGVGGGTKAESLGITCSSPKFR